MRSCDQNFSIQMKTVKFQALKTGEIVQKLCGGWLEQEESHLILDPGLVIASFALQKRTWNLEILHLFSTAKLLGSDIINVRWALEKKNMEYSSRALWIFSSCLSDLLGYFTGFLQGNQSF